MSIWQEFWGAVWLTSEHCGIPLGPIAPWVLAQYLGAKEYEKVSDNESL